MKYFWTLVWGFLLVHVVGYVGNSMLGTPYDFKEISVIALLAVVVLIFVATVAEVKPQTEE